MTVIAARLGLFQPKSQWQFLQQSCWPANWQSQSRFSETFINVQYLPVWKAVLPYALIVVLLVITRLPEMPFKTFLSGFEISATHLLGTKITASINLLYLPGSIFILVVLVCMPLLNINMTKMLEITKHTLSAFTNAAIVLLIAVPMVRIFIQSGVNNSGLDSMPIELARAIADLAGQAWPVFAALIGVLGAFIGGSNTISNLTFALFQFGVGLKTNLSPIIIVALQAVGGAAGNMICIHNIVAASATCGLSGQEGDLIRKTIIPTFYYLIMAGFTGCLLIYW
jgi:lactate permease